MPGIRGRVRCAGNTRACALCRGYEGVCAVPGISARVRCAGDTRACALCREYAGVCAVPGIRGRVRCAGDTRACALCRVRSQSDEKIFSVEAVSNSRNDRIYAHHTSELADASQTVFHRQHPAGVMVWAAV